MSAEASFSAAPAASLAAEKGLVVTGLAIIAMTFGGFGIWAASSPLSGAVIVSGHVVVESERKTVQHLEGGIVKRILVKSGSLVAEGEPLLLDSIAAVVILLLPICGQIYALYRAVLVEDDDEGTYRVTIRWFVWSVAGMLVAVCLAAFVLSGAFPPRSR